MTGSEEDGPPRTRPRPILQPRRRKRWYWSDRRGRLVVRLSWRQTQRWPAWPLPRNFRPERIAFDAVASRALRGPGLTLAGLFDTQIAHDPTLRRLIDEASGHQFAEGDRRYRFDALEVLDRRYREDMPLWPAVLKGYDLFVDWCDFPFRRFADRRADTRKGLLDHLYEDSLPGAAALRTARSAVSMVRRRYEAVMATLRSAKLEAFGRAEGGRGMEQISPAEWSAPGLRIDFNESQVGRAREPGGMDGMNVVWTGVVVKPPPQPEAAQTTGSDSTQQSNVGEAKETESLPRDVGGRPPKHQWDLAYDELVCFLAENGMPSTGIKNDLSKMMIDAFERLGLPKPDAKQAGAWLSRKNTKLWLIAGRKP